MLYNNLWIQLLPSSAPSDARRVESLLPLVSSASHRILHIEGPCKGRETPLRLPHVINTHLSPRVLFGVYSYIMHQLTEFMGTAVAQWLRCCATNRNVAGSIPDGFIGIFH